MKSDAILKKNMDLKGLHQGKRCFIIANGPSVENQNILLLKDEIKICVNQYYNYPHFKELPPNYWIQADPLIWQKKDAYLKPLLNSIESNRIVTKLFFPLEGMFQTQGSCYLNIYFFKYDYSHKHINDEIEFGREIPPYGQNVLLVCLMLAFYLGCNPIYIIGADHSWWAWKKKDYFNRHTPHFYGKQSVAASDRFSFEEMQATILVQKYQYLQLKKYAAQRGFNIFNATEGGELDLFERVTYANLFADPHHSAVNDQPLSLLPGISKTLCLSALELIHKGQFESALVLIDEAIRQNINKKEKVLGLRYLRSLCLTGLGHYPAAINEARQSYICHPENRENVANLLKALEDQFPEN